MMKELIERLQPIKDDQGDDVYEDAKIRAAAEVIELAGGGLLAVSEDGIHVSFVVFRFSSGPATRDGIVVSGAEWERVFHGSGPSGALRELRHTCWGEKDNGGYIFYPNGKLIADAFAKLERWFDCT